MKSEMYTTVQKFGVFEYMFTKVALITNITALLLSCLICWFAVQETCLKIV